ncbi:MAG: type II secretion system protein [Rickettsiales bacterium]
MNVSVLYTACRHEPCCPCPARRGFSLVELSIVLASWPAGRWRDDRPDAHQGAELRSIMTAFDRYKTAMVAFRDKYDCCRGI